MREAEAPSAAMVNWALAFPPASNVTVVGFRVHVSAPACAGSTEQVSDTGLLNAFSRLRLTLDIALCPGLTEFGMGLEAEIENLVPTAFSRTLMVPSPEFATTMSGDSSPFRSMART